MFVITKSVTGKKALIELCGIETVSYTHLDVYKRQGTQIRIKGQRRGADGYVDVTFDVTVGSKE